MNTITAHYVTDALNKAAQSSRSGLARQAFRTMAAWIKISRERRALADLSPELRADVGISDDFIARAARQPFWQIDPLTRDRFGL